MVAYEKKVKDREQALIRDMSPITHELTIKWEMGRWVVTSPAASAWRGLDSIRWTLAPDDAHSDVSAHFQFADMELFEDDPALTPDRTAMIARAGDELILKVHKHACRRTNPHLYAVWISDRAHPNGGEYAVGQDRNPPPEVCVGP
jgi:hypothetical protein